VRKNFCYRHLAIPLAFACHCILFRKQFLSLHLHTMSKTEGEKVFPSVKYLYRLPMSFIYSVFFPRHALLPANTFTATLFF